jgi:hypothetical protein
MKRAQELAGFTALCTLATLALTALLGGCSHNDAAVVASTGTDDTPVSVSPDGLPEVVITASRPTVKPIVLSAKDSNVTGK